MNDFGAPEFPEAVWELQTCIGFAERKHTNVHSTPKYNFERNRGSESARNSFSGNSGIQAIVRAIRRWALGVRAKVRLKGNEPRKPPYFARCYDVGNLQNVNIVAFIYPLLADGR